MSRGLRLDWLVRGPWRDPQGFNFPQTVGFPSWQMLPTIGSTVHIGVILALLVALGLAFCSAAPSRDLKSASSAAPRAPAAFAGFSQTQAW